MISQPLLHPKSKELVSKAVLFVLSLFAVFTCVMLVKQNLEITDLRNSLSLLMNPEEDAVGAFDEGKSQLWWVFHQTAIAAKTSKTRFLGIHWFVCQTDIGKTPEHEDAKCYTNTNGGVDAVGKPYQITMRSWKEHLEKNHHVTKSGYADSTDYEALLGWAKMCEVERSSESIWDDIKKAFHLQCQDGSDHQCDSEFAKYDPSASFGLKSYADPRSFANYRSEIKEAQGDDQHANCQALPKLMDNTYCHGKNMAKMNVWFKWNRYGKWDESGKGHWNGKKAKELTTPLFEEGKECWEVYIPGSKTSLMCGYTYGRHSKACVDEKKVDGSETEKKGCCCKLGYKLVGNKCVACKITGDSSSEEEVSAIDYYAADSSEGEH